MIRHLSMQCIILAAGRGTRMGNLTDTCPKPMLPLAGRPKLAWSMDLLPSAVDEVIMVVGYLQEHIRSYFGTHYNHRTVTYVEQRELNGTAGAVALCASYVRGSVLVMMGDDLYMQSDLEQLLRYEQALLAMPTDDAQRYGVVTTDADGNLTGVTERPHEMTTGLVNTGAYVLAPAYFQYTPVKISEREYGLPQTLAAMYPDTLTHVVHATRWCAVGNAQDIAQAHEELPFFADAMHA